VGWFIMVASSLLAIALCLALVAGVMGGVAWLSPLILNSSLSIFVSYPLIACLCYGAFEASMWGIMHLLNRIL
jgi:hypothetical protein